MSAGLESSDVLENFIQGLRADNCLLAKLVFELLDTDNDNDVEVLGALLWLLQGDALTFLFEPMLISTIESYSDSSLLFRSGTRDTIVLKQFLKVHSRQFLGTLLRSPMRKVTSKKGDLEVNPALNSDADQIASNVESISLLTVCFWDQIFKSVADFPVALCVMCAAVEQALRERFSPELGNELSADDASPIMKAKHAKQQQRKSRRGSRRLTSSEISDTETASPATSREVSPEKTTSASAPASPTKDSEDDESLTSSKADAVSKTKRRSRSSSSTVESSPAAAADATKDRVSSKLDHPSLIAQRTQWEKQAVSSVLFLRLICPALLSPASISEKINAKVDDRIQRALVTITKITQTLANGSEFQNFMAVFNPLLQKNEVKYHRFCRQIILVGRKYLLSMPSARVCDKFYGDEAQSVYQFMKRRERSIMEALEALELNAEQLTVHKDNFVVCMISIGRYERQGRRKATSSEYRGSSGPPRSPSQSSLTSIPGNFRVTRRKSLSSPSLFRRSKGE